MLRGLSRNLWRRFGSTSGHAKTCCETVFLGLRDDKAPKDVVRESATVEPAPPKASSKRTKRLPQRLNRPLQRLNRLVKRSAPDVDSGLDLKGKEVVVEVDQTKLKLTNLDKLYYPRDGIAKRDLLEFYDQAAEWLLPHLRDRPLSLKRYPNGIDSQSSFQKNASEHSRNGCARNRCKKDILQNRIIMSWRTTGLHCSI